MEIYARYRKIEPNWQRLEDHLINVGNFAELFGKEIGLGSVLKLAGFLHDIGKATDDWQRYLWESVKEGRKRRKEDHASLGAKVLVDLFENRNNEEEVNSLKVLKAALEAVIMYHHGSGLPDFIGLDGSSQFKERLNKTLFAENNDVLNRISAGIKKELEIIINSDVLKKEIEILKAKDKISNIETEGQKRIKQKHFQFERGLCLRNMSSCLIDADRLDSAAFEEKRQIDCSMSFKIPDWNSLLGKLENYLEGIKGGDEISCVREELSASCAAFGEKEKGIYSCSAVTGSGKTFASLRFALTQARKHGMKHVFIIAPYTSIIDQNAEKIRGVLETDGEKKVVLEYHSNVVFENEEEEGNGSDGVKPDIDLWNYPVIVTTMVQFLNSLFGSGTRKIRRMHQMINSVIIFDEIQTLPVKVTFMFNWALEYLVNSCGCSVMLCTATQPGLNRIAISDEGKFTPYECGEYNLNISGEVVPDVEKHFDSLKRVLFIDKTVKTKKKTSQEEIAEYIKEQMQNLNSFLAVVNTKKQAKELFDLIKPDGLADYCVYHLSTDMCPTHRKKVIEEMIERLRKKEKTVCISTSLIEAGVDISFEGALRYLAGLDSIIQTAGRCNRNGGLINKQGKYELGKVAIFDCEKENEDMDSAVYKAKNATGRVLREMRNEDSIVNLNDYNVIRDYFFYYYGSFERKELSYFGDSKDFGQGKTGSVTILDLLSDNRNLKAEYKVRSNKKWSLPFSQSFKTAWEMFEVIPDNTVGIISYYGEGKDIIGKLKSLERYDEFFYSKVSKILKEAQPYTVNIYYYVFDKLKKNGMVKEIIENSGIYALEEGYYDFDKGISEEIVPVKSLMTVF